VSEAGQLISGYFDASLTDQEVEELDALLLTDRDQAPLFARLAILHSAIRDTVESERSLLDMPAGIDRDNVDPASIASDPAATLRGLPTNLPDPATDDTAPAAPIPLKKPQRGSLGRRSALAAAILLLAGTALIILLQHAGSSPQPIAMGQSLDAIWSDPSSVPPAGTFFKNGVAQSLTSGYAELTSANGLTVVVQGPATFTVEKPGVVSLASGRLTATVPKPARGFTVNTPVASVVDLGTEFGVSVSAAGETDVQTFRGTISLSSTVSTTASSASAITAGLARHVGSSGDITEIAANTTAFVRPQQFEDWKAMPQRTPYERWKGYSERLRADPDLIAYYTFDKSDASAQRLLNCASTGAALDGVLGGSGRAGDLPRWTVGRWPAKGALGFAAWSHQRVDIPAAIRGPLDSSRGAETAAPFTICVWIRSDDPHPSHTSIVLKGAKETGQFAVELFPDSSVRTWVGNAAIPGATARIDGSWHYVALTYEPQRGAAQFYLDGVLVAATANAPRQLPRTTDALTLGSRALGRLAFLPPMVGRIDELSVFRRALSAEEVKNMYLAEKPG
jgi:hypothetical protein